MKAKTTSGQFDDDDDDRSADVHDDGKSTQGSKKKKRKLHSLVKTLKSKIAARQSSGQGDKAKPKFINVGGRIVPVDATGKPEETDELGMLKKRQSGIRKALAAVQKQRAQRLEEVQRERDKVSKGSIK